MSLNISDRQDFAAAYMAEQALDVDQWSHDRRVAEAALSGCELNSIVSTHEIFADFVAAHGTPHKTWVYRGQEMHYWRRVKLEFGRARGDLYMMEFNGVAASLFTGAPRSQ